MASPATLVGATATAIASAVRSGQVTPSEVVAGHLDAIARRDAGIGAFVLVRTDAALAEAAALGERDDLASLPLAGVPVAVKDVVDVAGEPTRHGSVATSDAPAAGDDPTVARLRAAGAIIVGKTRGPEMSIWASADDAGGIARNPWDPSRVPGGSSGGSAAGVAAGMVPLALGSDGLGSVRIPAAACGVFGIRPAAGLVPMHAGGRGKHWFGMTQYGPLATTVGDAALMLDVLAASQRFATVTVPTQPLRVAVSVASPAVGVSIDDAYVEATLDAGRVLRHAGHHVGRDDPPYEPRVARDVMARWSQGVAQDVDELVVDESALQARTRRHVQAGRKGARFWPVDDADAARWRAAMTGFFADHDVLLTPALAAPPIEAVPWAQRSWRANVMSNLRYAPFASPWNLADLPAGVVPYTRAGGLPLAVQVVAPPGREDLVLALARQLEQMVGWPRHAPVGL